MWVNSESDIWYDKDIKEVFNRAIEFMDNEGITDYRMFKYNGGEDVFTGLEDELAVQFTLSFAFPGRQHDVG